MNNSTSAIIYLHLATLKSLTPYMSLKYQIGVMSYW